MFNQIHTTRVQLNDVSIMTDYDKIENNSNYNNFVQGDIGSRKIKDKFVINNYKGIKVYERQKGYNATSKNEELIKVLEYFNKYHGHNQEFNFEDFEALEPNTLKRLTEKIWYPVYDGFEYKRDETQTNVNDSLSCACSQECGSLYLIRNIKTNKYFGVGSVCINKFIDGEFQKNIIRMKREVMKTLCSRCYESFNYNTLKNNKIQNKQYCNKCIKTITVTLNIKYDEKDKYKKYGTKWDRDNKTWYISGNHFHPDLNEKIDEVQFEEKINFIEDDQ